jgi:glycerophosphoryl diester phosphodiesterase
MDGLKACLSSASNSIKVALDLSLIVLSKGKANMKIIKKIVTVLLMVIMIGLLGAYFYLSSPEALDPNRIQWLESSLIAHRGLHEGNIPENSMDAFSAAIEGGYIIELDAQITKDNKIVVLHDNDLNRMLGIDKLITEVTYEELQTYNILGSDQKVPLLSDVLALVDDQVPLLIEIKNDLEVGLLEGALYEVLKNYEGRFAVIAFNPYSLAWFKTNAPDFIRGQVSGHFSLSEADKAKGVKRLVYYKRFMLSNLLMNFESRPNFIVYEIKDTPLIRILSIKLMNVPLIGYAVDDQDEYDQVSMMYDNLMVNTDTIK